MSKDPLTMQERMDDNFFGLQRDFKYVARTLDPNGSDWWPDPLVLPDGMVGGCCASWCDEFLRRARLLSPASPGFFLCRAKVWCERGSDPSRADGRGYHAIVVLVAGEIDTPAGWGLQTAYDLRQSVPCTPTDLVRDRGYGAIFTLNAGSVDQPWQAFSIGGG